MNYSGYAFKTEEENKPFKEAIKVAKKKLEGLKWEKENTWTKYGRYGYTIQFEDTSVDITEMDVISGIANVPFGGTCNKVAPGRFEVMEYTD